MPAANKPDNPGGRLARVRSNLPLAESGRLIRSQLMLSKPVTLIGKLPFPFPNFNVLWPPPGMWSLGQKR